MIPLPNISLAAALKLGVAAFVALAVGLLIHQRDHWKAVAADRQVQLVQVKSAFDQTIADYRAAAEKARAADAANLVRVKTEQAAINQQSEYDYEMRIAAVRAAAQRLRAHPAAAADPRAGRAATVPGISAAAQGSAQAPRKDRLSVGDRQLATEQAIQLDELIKWVRRQVRVDTNSAVPPVLPDRKDEHEN